MHNLSVKYLAIHLPQFHPIPENDMWWGRGFTEWRNVAKAKPLFLGHYQPHLPADLGFYDLRLPEARIAQSELAKAYGIDGFCYFHYWFKGRRLLEKPVNEIIDSGKPVFPFCLFWANQTWEGRWHGLVKEKKVLVRQEYSKEDDLNHVRWLANVMSDKRYFRVDNRPVFVIYDPLNLPEPEKTIEVWRKEFLRLGIPDPYLIGSNASASIKRIGAIGLDAVLQHLPQLGVLNNYVSGLQQKIRRFLRNASRGFFSSELQAYDYEEALRKMIDMHSNSVVYKSLCPSWDNTPRCGKRGVVLTDSTPKKFEKFLYELSTQTMKQFPANKQLLFLNAWNEWAEGNHLEPDLKYGMGYLEAVKNVKDRLAGLRASPSER